MNELQDLYLYGLHDGDLYRQQRESIEKNLQRKYNKGVYDKEKAAKLWLYFAENVAKKYHKDFNYSGKWFQLFNIEIRRKLAGLFESDHFDLMKCRDDAIDD
jgi:nuclear transport factor 2 (NTF2) superfamily protein